MKAVKLGLIISLPALIFAFSCNIDSESPFKPSGLENDEGLYDLYLYNVNTNVTSMITSSSDNIEWSYSFSPDSKKILYKDDFGINEMNIDGSDNWFLMSSGSSPCYSPDGRKIAFTDDQKLYLVNTDGSDKTQICNTNIGLMYPLWSNDGSTIACSSDSGLCIVALDGTLKVFPDVKSDGFYEWSSDSKDIFYEKSFSGSAHIFRYNFMLDKQTQITYDDKFNYSPTCNPINNEIVFISSRADYGTDLVITDQDGSSRRVILHKTLISSPCWSPTGDKIAFITGDSDLGVIDRNGENFKIINEIPGACKEPQWSNDGNYILYTRAIFNMK
jgi:Tol biopolymer transport system component